MSEQYMMKAYALDGSGERGVVVRVGVSAELGGDGDVTRELGEERRTLGVDCGLLVLSGSPLRVSGHMGLLCILDETH